MARRALPNSLRIAEYWTIGAGHGTFPKLFYSEPGCFACGYLFTSRDDVTIERRWMSSTLERCHLIADSAGGSVKVSNVVLLCKSCHRAAPMIGTSAQPMIDWINRREAYVNVLIERMTAELRALDPKLPEGLSAMFPKHDEFIAHFKGMCDALQVGYHPGGKVISTVAAVLHGLVRYRRAINRGSARRPPDGG